MPPDEQHRPIENIHEKVIANSILTLASGKSSGAIDSFASWLLGGFGAALALLISNLDSLKGYLPVSAVKSAAVLFIIASVAGIFEKYLAAIVAGSVETSTMGKEIGEKSAELELDFSVIFKEAEKATIPPMKWLMRRTLDKAAKGDLAAHGRFVSRCSQAQGLFALIEAALILCAASTLIGNLAA